MLTSTNQNPNGLKNENDDFITVVVPTFNGQSRISECLDALLSQTFSRQFRILVIDDGSTDKTGNVIKQYSNVDYCYQENKGASAARNKGIELSNSEFIVFTDDDCVPEECWLEKLMEPFERIPDLTAVKGAYLTRQDSLVAQFVQFEYEDRYELLKRSKFIDFIDTYSACFRRDVLVDAGGYDDNFPAACAEDAEFSYRLANAGAKMIFVPSARVYHSHPSDFLHYVRRKYKYAFWRMLATKKNPNKLVKDSHTPQLLKIQLLFPAGLVISVPMDAMLSMPFSATGTLVGLFVLSTVPNLLRIWKKSRSVAMVALPIFFGRSIAQFFGVFLGGVKFFIIERNRNPIAKHLI